MEKDSRLDAVILAGGLGTRLRTEVADLPKPMAPINGEPFLTYLFRYLEKQNIGRAVLATGYLHEKIESYYRTAFGSLRLFYSIEHQPLGTGGSIRQAFAEANTKHVFVLNGDTFFDVDLPAMRRCHFELGADLTIALKPMKNISRYGVVKFEGTRVTRFEEKKAVDFGHINGGVYLAKKSLFDHYDLPEKFSLEENFLKEHSGKLQIHAFLSDTYFIDIGIPEDYQRAQEELSAHG